MKHIKMKKITLEELENFDFPTRSLEINMKIKVNLSSSNQWDYCCLEHQIIKMFEEQPYYLYDNDVKFSYKISDLKT